MTEAEVAHLVAHRNLNLHRQVVVEVRVAIRL